MKDSEKQALKALDYVALKQHPNRGLRDTIHKEPGAFFRGTVNLMWSVEEQKQLLLKSMSDEEMLAKVMIYGSITEAFIETLKEDIMKTWKP